MEPIIGFTAADDGVGFTAQNMSSFETLDSDFKSDLGCRGVGRLLCSRHLTRCRPAARTWTRTGSSENERQARRTPANARPSCRQDAYDVDRLLVAIPTDELTTTFIGLLGDEVAAGVTRAAPAFLTQLFGTADGVGSSRALSCERRQLSSISCCGTGRSGASIAIPSEAKRSKCRVEA